MRASSPSRAPARRNTPAKKPTCVERLQALTGATTSVDDILGEIFPFQCSYRRAELLLTPVSTQRMSRQTKRTTSPSRGDARATRDNKRAAAASPLQAIDRPSSPLRVTARAAPSRSSGSVLVSNNRELAAKREHDQHALALWEDKFRARSLSPQDVLFLVTHDDISRVLEGASLLRVAGLTYDQLMELEVALESTRRSRTDRSQCLYLLLCDNVWQQGIAFKTGLAGADVQRTSGEMVNPRRMLLTPLPSPSNAASTTTFAIQQRQQTIKRASSWAELAARPVRSPPKTRQQRLQTALPHEHRYDSLRTRGQVSTSHELHDERRCCQLESQARAEHYAKEHREISTWV